MDELRASIVKELYALRGSDDDRAEVADRILSLPRIAEALEMVRLVRSCAPGVQVGYIKKLTDIRNVDEV